MPANSGLFSILFSFPQSTFFSFFLKFFHWTTGEVPHILLMNLISSQGFESQLYDATGKENLSLLPFWIL